MDVRYRAPSADQALWEYTESHCSSQSSSAEPKITIKKKIFVRPKSVPSSLRKALLCPDSVYNNPNRPKTATGNHHHSECERFNELEYEPTRKQAFEPHLPTRKGRPPPWQKQLDGPPANCVIAPGYILARGKSRVSMVIDPNQFFKGAPQDKLQKENQDHASVNESCDLIAELSQQIDDLTLHLEEEKLNHKETKRKAADILRDKLEDANNRHSENVRQLKEQHAEEMENTRKAHREEIEVHKRDSEATLKKVQGELDFLQGAFESYKSHVAQEMQEKWKLREEEISIQHRKKEISIQHRKKEISIQHRKTQDAHLKQMRSKFTAERNQERSDESKQHRQHLSDLKKDHTKDLEKLERRYKDTADLQNNFSKMQSELETTKDALSSLQVDYDSTCLQLASTTHQLTDTKIKLVSLEEQFQDRVAAVDNSYLQKIHGLMSQNTELRRLYMKKCGELYDEKSITDVNRDQKLESAKDAMKFSCVGDDAADHELLFWMEIFRRIQNDLEVVINTRKNADISIAAVDTDIDQCPRNAKDRPASAPGTRHEVTAAQLSAGETAEPAQTSPSPRQLNRPYSCKPCIIRQVLADDSDDQALFVRGHSRSSLQQMFKGSS